MTISNPRWIIDGDEVTSFVYGRVARMTVDVQNFPGGELVFSVRSPAIVPPLTTVTVTAPAVGLISTLVAAPVVLTYQWPVLTDFPTTYSHYNACCDAKTSLPYRTDLAFLADPISDDVLFPPLYFTVSVPGQADVTSPTIRRELPQFVPGNKVELLVNGDVIKPSVLAAIAGAQHHVHLDWFFFDTQAAIADALIAAAQRGVEVRLLFDQFATATPEPIGQGISPGDFIDGMHSLRQAGVTIGMSSMLIAPLDNLLALDDPEYADRLAVQKQYVKRLLLTRSGLLQNRALINLTVPGLGELLPQFLQDANIGPDAFGTQAIGTPVLLGGCRDHTKLIVVDGSIAFCGGANAQRYYIYDEPINPGQDATEEANDPGTSENWLRWHDCFIRYEGPAVTGAQRYFAERWAVCTGEYLDRTSTVYFPVVPPAGTASVKVISNVPGLERDIEAEYLRMFRNSTMGVMIENPYLTDDLIATFLAHTAQVRQLPVDLYVPDKYLDFAIARDLMKSRWDSLRAAGINLYAYNSHMLHVKVATADGHLSIVSSYNFAKSSAAQLFEHGVVVDDANFATSVAIGLMGVDKLVSTPVTTSVAPDWTADHTVMRLLDRIV